MMRAKLGNKRSASTVGLDLSATRKRKRKQADPHKVISPITENASLDENHVLDHSPVDIETPPMNGQSIALNLSSTSDFEPLNLLANLAAMKSDIMGYNGLWKPNAEVVSSISEQHVNYDGPLDLSTSSGDSPTKDEPSISDANNNSGVPFYRRGITTDNPLTENTANRRRNQQVPKQTRSVTSTVRKLCIETDNDLRQQQLHESFPRIDKRSFAERLAAEIRSNPGNRHNQSQRRIGATNWSTDFRQVSAGANFELTDADDADTRPIKKNYKNMTRERRIEANARERTRVHTISAAFEALRCSVPCYSPHQKLSKLAILRIASVYIMSLAKLLGKDYAIQACHRKLTFVQCVELLTAIIQEGCGTRGARLCGCSSALNCTHSNRSSHSAASMNTNQHHSGKRNLT